jgi:hypothetical protein
MVTTMGKPTDELSSLILIVSEARGHFLQMLEASVQHQDTKGTCLFAVVFCSTLINRYTSFTAIIRGGDGEGDGGLLIGDQNHGHYWIEIDVHGQTFIVDITGDQFGLEPVIVSAAGALTAKYIPGCQATVDEHVSDMKLSFCQA